MNLRESGGGGDYEYGKDIVLQVVLRSTDNIDIAVFAMNVSRVALQI